MHLSIIIDGDATNTDLNLGSLTLSCGGREYILDPVQSYRTFERGETTVEVQLERDDETFPDCPYDLTDVDLYDSNLKAEFFLESEESFDLRCMFLFVTNGEKVKAIDVREESQSMVGKLLLT